MTQRTVLYVEDNEYNRKIVRQLLGRTGYRLVEAVDGEAGVAAAFAAVPDLILMDVQLRADERTKDIPIIVITSFAMSGDRERATAAGASGYVAKPYSPRELLAQIREFLPEEAP